MGKKLYYAFVDLEKAFDRVLGEVTRWTLRKASVGEWLVSAIMAMYDGALTVVRTLDGNSDSFELHLKFASEVSAESIAVYNSNEHCFLRVEGWTIVGAL